MNALSNQDFFEQAAEIALSQYRFMGDPVAPVSASPNKPN